MHSKILGAALLLVCVQALPLEQQYHQATSFASFNEQHNTIHHILSAPTILKTSVVTPVQVAPVHVAPVQVAPVHVAPVHVAPVHVAPVAIKTVAPQSSAQSYSSISIGHNTASAPVAVHAAPLVVKSIPIVATHQHEEEHYGPAKYEFAYGVEDHHTGDIHSQKESRDGDLTKGEYSLHEADGTIRTVKYTVDKHSGFNAVVERSGHAVHAQPAQHH